MKTGPVGCPETSVRNYHYMLHDIPEVCSSHLLVLRGGSLKSHVHETGVLRYDTSELKLRSFILYDFPYAGYLKSTTIGSFRAFNNKCVSVPKCSAVYG